eukprot:3032060-Rhodomonas_salina.1
MLLRACFAESGTDIRARWYQVKTKADYDLYCHYVAGRPPFYAVALPLFMAALPLFMATLPLFIAALPLSMAACASVHGSTASIYGSMCLCSCLRVLTPALGC